MSGKAPGGPRFVSEDRTVAEGDARRVRVRDRVLGLPCLLRFAPVGSPAAERLAADASRLVTAEHPWLTPVVARFQDDPSASIAGHEPAAGYALHDPASPTLLEALAGASLDERISALTATVHVLDHLHQRGLVHGHLGPESVRWRDGAPWVVWGPVGPASPGDAARDDAPEADLHAVASLARSLLRGSTAPARRLFDRLTSPKATTPRPTARELLADLAATGAVVVAPRVADPEASPDTTSIVAALPHLGRPLVLVGGAPGAGMSTARRALSGLADSGWRTLDLSRSASAMGTLHRWLMPPERPPTFDVEWAEALRHALAEPRAASAILVGDLSRWSLAERALVESVLQPLARAGILVLLASPSPVDGACPVRMPAPDAHDLPVPEGVADVLRDLRGLPPGIPSRVLASLPSAARTALPALARSGHARFDDEGALHLTGAGTEPLEPTLAATLEHALLDPIGETDPLWRAVAWARSRRLDRAGLLFAMARGVAAGREDLLVEVALALAPAGHVGARQFLAEMDLLRGRPHRAIATLASLPEGDARTSLLLGQALRLGGRATEAVATLSIAAERHDEGALWCEAARAHLAVGRTAEASLALDRAVRSPVPPPAHALLAARVHVARATVGPATPQAVLAVLEALGRADVAPPGLLARVAQGISRQGDAPHAASLLGVALARAEASSAVHLAGTLHLALAEHARRAGLEVDALAGLHEALLVGRQAGWGRLERTALTRLADLEIATGRLEEARLHLQEAAQAGARSQGGLGDEIALVGARLALARGEPAKALVELDRVDPTALSDDRAVGHALARGQALLESGRPGEARHIAESTPMPTDPGAARGLLALRGRIHLALGRRLLDDAHQRLPADPRPTERAAVGEILLAWAGEDVDAADLPDRARALGRAAGLLAGPAKARAQALAAGWVAPVAPPAPPPVAEAPRVPAAPREVLGVLLGRHQEALAIETTMAMLDPTRSNNLLLTGPTGAGKRVFAERIARERLGLEGLEEVVLRRTDPQMLVSQLVGTRRGEFTGAVDQVGAIQRAIRSRKALLLDELHTLDRVGQEILLPLLELPRRRFGGLLRSSQEIDGPLHILLATNVDVSGSQWRELFRSDLWFRMSQLHVHLPSLAERGPEATQIYFARMLADEGFADPEEVLDPRALYTLLAQSWEGNLRELHAAARRVGRFRRQQDRRITPDDLPRLSVGAEIPSIAPFGSRDVLETLELNAVVEALRRCDWNQSAAADHLAISKYRMHRILHKHELIDWVRDHRKAASGSDE